MKSCASGCGRLPHSGAGSATGVFGLMLGRQGIKLKGKKLYRLYKETG